MATSETAVDSAVVEDRDGQNLVQLSRIGQSTESRQEVFLDSTSTTQMSTSQVLLSQSPNRPRTRRLQAVDSSSSSFFLSSSGRDSWNSLPDSSNPPLPRTLLSPISVNMVESRARSRQKVASVGDLAVDMRENFHIGASSLFKPNYQEPLREITPCKPLATHPGAQQVQQLPAVLPPQPLLPPPVEAQPVVSSTITFPASRTDTDATMTDDEPTPRDSDKRQQPSTRSHSIRRKPVPSLHFGPALPARPAASVGYQRVPSLVNGSPYGGSMYSSSSSFDGGPLDASPVDSRRYKTHRSSFDIRLHNPASGHPSEKLSSLCWPPPSKVRRTQSMFATPEQMLHEQLGDASAGSSLEDPALYISKRTREVPTFTVRQDPFRRITHETLCALLDGSYAHVFDTVRVIDCRFEYEYEGGHISGAVNISSKPKLEQLLLGGPEAGLDSRSLLVFHCEYSAYRGPIMAAHLRRCDRQRNYQSYPQLSYPDIVILDGGYSGFFELHMNRCQPQNYVEMNDTSHQNSRERELSRFRSHLEPRTRHRKTASQTSEFGRAFTFPARPFASFIIPAGSQSASAGDSSSPRRPARSASII